MKKLFAIALFAGATLVHAQAHSTASRLADGQVGISFVNANSDYATTRYNGYGAYVDLDFHRGFGGEFEFNFISDGTSTYNIYERTYEIGPRYSREYGRFRPFVKAMVGRGVFNFPYNSANVAYNLYAAGVGTDVRVRSRVNVRAGYEYQRWYNFQPSALSPSLLSVGVAYHFK